MVALFWVWTVAAWTGGALVGVALASALTPNKEPPASAGQDVIISERTSVTIEEIPAEEDEVDGSDALVDAVRN